VCRTAASKPIAIGLTARCRGRVRRPRAGIDRRQRGDGRQPRRRRVTEIASKFSMLAAGHLLFSHSPSFGTRPPGRKRSDRCRSQPRLVALRGAIGRPSKSSAPGRWFRPPSTNNGPNRFIDGCNAKVLPLDPLRSVERDPRVADAIADRSLFAGPIGLLLAKSDRASPLSTFSLPAPPVARNVQRQRGDSGCRRGRGARGDSGWISMAPPQQSAIPDCRSESAGSRFDRPSRRATRPSKA